jgi:hypothetical protein
MKDIRTYGQCVKSRLPNIGSWKFYLITNEESKMANLYRQVNILITNDSYNLPYENHVDLIMDSLWLGNAESAHNIKFIFYNKIKYIINVTKEIQDKFTHVKSITYIRLPMNDSDACKEKLLSVMEKGADHINDIITSQFSVLVHCKRGHHRSASIVALYLMKYYRMPLLDAIQLIKKIRPSTFRRMTCMLRSLIYYECARIV